MEYLLRRFLLKFLLMARTGEGGGDFGEEERSGAALSPCVPSAVDGWASAISQQASQPEILREVRVGGLRGVRVRALAKGWSERIGSVEAGAWQSRVRS